jgi:hypothetical protein
MSGIQTNFRAEDMLGGVKQEVVVTAPKKVDAPKASVKKVEVKPEPVAEVETEVEKTVVEPEVVVEDVPAVEDTEE